MRPLIIIGEQFYITQSIARVLSGELSCPVHLFRSVDSWKQSLYTQCLAFVVVDVSTSLGLFSCCEVVSQLKHLSNDVPIIVISDVDASATVEENFRCGARGYISTSTTLHKALEAVRLVLSGGTFAPGGTVLPDHRSNKGN